MTEQSRQAFWNGKRVVITGANGFLGSRINARLGDYGADITNVSRSTGTDLRDPAQARSAIAAASPDTVFNCAARQGGIEFQKLEPASIFMDNMLMGIHTMEAARVAGVQKYVNVVAGCSYPGYGDVPVLTEDEYWAGPLHETVVNYGMSKKIQTVQGELYQRQYNFTSIHLIMTNLYGPGEHFHPDRSHALAALIRKFYEAKRDGTPEVVVWGTGKPIREWMYVDDAAEAVVRAAEVAQETTMLNVGMGTGYTITELAETIQSVIGYTGDIVYDTDKPDGAARKVMSTSRMDDVLGNLPRVPLEEGIKRTLDWFVENYDEVIAEPATH